MSLIIKESLGGSCYNAIGEVHDAMAEVLPPGVNYVVLGGIPTAALLHPDTEIDTGTKMIAASRDSDPGAIRNNGTLRDIDLLVTANLTPEEKQDVYEAVDKTVGGRLLVSLFDIEQREKQTNRLRQLSRALSPFTLRTIDKDGIHRFEISGIEQPVKAESYEPWGLELPNGSQVNVLHPIGHALAYVTRSIAGIRAKDGDKGQKLVGKLEPFMDEIGKPEGLFYEWAAFADTIRQTRLYGSMPHRVRAEIFARVEANERLLTVAQSPVMKRFLSPVIGSHS